MFKATLISTFFAVTAVQATAEPGDLSLLPADVAARIDHLQQYGDRFERAIEATLVEWSKPVRAGADILYDLSNLPEEVASRVAELQKHGERFAPAIRAILVAAGKPSWTFEDCGHEGTGITIAMIEG